MKMADTLRKRAVISISTFILFLWVMTVVVDNVNRPGPIDLIRPTLSLALALTTTWLVAWTIALAVKWVIKGKPRKVKGVEDARD